MCAVKFREIVGREFGLVLEHIFMTQSLLITQRMFMCCCFLGQSSHCLWIKSLCRGSGTWCAFNHEWQQKWVFICLLLFSLLKGNLEPCSVIFSFLLRQYQGCGVTFWLPGRFPFTHTSVLPVQQLGQSTFRPSQTTEASLKSFDGILRGFHQIITIFPVFIVNPVRGSLRGETTNNEPSRDPLQDNKTVQSLEGHVVCFPYFPVLMQGQAFTLSVFFAHYWMFTSRSSSHR